MRVCRYRGRLGGTRSRSEGDTRSEVSIVRRHEL
jgi:hypothetical protein